MRLDRLGRVLAHPWTEYQVTKAKNTYRKANPCCAVCGRSKPFFGRAVDVHHMVPVHVDPSRACDQNNFISMCRIHHYLIGHLQDWKNYCLNIYTVITEINKVYYYTARPGK
jgi:hypothetical protein